MTINIAVQISCPPDKVAIVTKSNDASPVLMRNGDTHEFAICKINSLNVTEGEAADYPLPEGEVVEQPEGE